MEETPNNLAAQCWSIADLLRGDFKQSQHGRIILPFTLLRRLECVLEESKELVLELSGRPAALEWMNSSEEDYEHILFEGSGLKFFNTSDMNLSTMVPSEIKSNLEDYIQCFTRDVREIFEHFSFSVYLDRLNETGLLYKVVEKIKSIDLSEEAVSDYDMGLVFEELVRRFAEGSNETTGEHLTPRDVLSLVTSLVFVQDDEVLSKEGTIRSIYDPAAGSGGFLSSGIEYVHDSLKSSAVINAFAQEMNPESYAICKANMLIRGQDFQNIMLGNTLSNDQIFEEHYDYMLSAPPLGSSWGHIAKEIKEECLQEKFNGRFGPGLPRTSDSSLLFLLHLISKLRPPSEGGGRIGVIMNGSPLFTGGASSGESEIRRYIIESDLLEAIVAMPTDMLYNTGIATYIWVLSNKKSFARKGKIQLIDATNLYSKMRKSIGSKRNTISKDDIAIITRTFGAFESIGPSTLDHSSMKRVGLDYQSESAKAYPAGDIVSKIFDNHEFGYRRITIERPLRKSYQFSDERISELRFAGNSLNKPMRWIYDVYGESWSDEENCEYYGDLAEHEEEIRIQLNIKFNDLKGAKIKELLNVETWVKQKQILLTAKKIQAELSSKQFNDMNCFDSKLKTASEKQKFTLSSPQKKQIISAVSWVNQNAKKVIKRVHKKTEANPFYGLFDVKGRTIEYQPDVSLRDYEDVGINPNQTVSEFCEAYFKKEVHSHVPDAWIDATKKDGKDNEIGVVGYEVNFKQLISVKKDACTEKGTREEFRLKNIFTTHEKGDFEISLLNLSIKSAGSSNAKNSPYYPKIKVNRKKLNVNYFNIFIDSAEGADWGDSLDKVGHAKYVPLRKLMDARISLPSIAEQNQVIDLNEKYLALLENLRVMRPSLVSDYIGFERLLEPYLNATDRYLDAFQHKLPHPLSILWIQSQSSSGKNQCEELCKFYEYLCLYIASIMLSFVDTDWALRELQNGNTRKPTSLTMGSSWTIIDKFSKNPPQNFPEGMKCLYSAELIEVLREATDIRNDIAHRGLSSGQEIKEKEKRFVRLNEDMQSILRDFFSNYTMFTPINGIYDGSRFEYRIENLVGLALNPSIERSLKTDAPLTNGQLYIGHVDSSQEITKCYCIYPLIILDESIAESNFKAFYFYSDPVEVKRDEETKYKLRYVCPYPNVKMYKEKELSIMRLSEGDKPTS